MIGFREFLAGVIIMLGLALIGFVLLLALNRQVFEAMALALPATIVFRSGIGLLRMATAARLALKLQEARRVNS